MPSILSVISNIIYRIFAFYLIYYIWYHLSYILFFISCILLCLISYLSSLISLYPICSFLYLVSCYAFYPICYIWYHLSYLLFFYILLCPLSYLSYIWYVPACCYIMSACQNCTEVYNVNSISYCCPDCRGMVLVTDLVCRCTLPVDYKVQNLKCQLSNKVVGGYQALRPSYYDGGGCGMIRASLALLSLTLMMTFTL